MIQSCEICRKNNLPWPLLRAFYQDPGQKSERIPVYVHFLCALFFEDFQVIVSQKGIGVFGFRKLIISELHKPCSLCDFADSIPKVKCAANNCSQLVHIQCLDKKQNSFLLCQTTSFMTKVKCKVFCYQHKELVKQFGQNLKQLSLDRLIIDVNQFYNQFYEPNLPQELSQKVGYSSRVHVPAKSKLYEDQILNRAVSATSSNSHTGQINGISKKKLEKLNRKNKYRLQDEEDEMLQADNNDLENGQEDQESDSEENLNKKRHGFFADHHTFFDEDEQLYLDSGYPNYNDDDRPARMKQWWDQIDMLYFKLPEQKKIEPFFKEPSKKEQSKFSLQQYLIQEQKDTKHLKREESFQGMDENLKLNKNYYTDESLPFKSKNQFTVLWHIPNKKKEAFLMVYEIPPNLQTLKCELPPISNFTQGNFRIISQLDISRIAEHQQRCLKPYTQEDIRLFGRRSIQLDVDQNQLDDCLRFQKMAVLDTHGFQNALIYHAKLLALHQILEMKKADSQYVKPILNQNQQIGTDMDELAMNIVVLKHSIDSGKYLKGLKKKIMESYNKKKQEFKVEINQWQELQQQSEKYLNLQRYISIKKNFQHGFKNKEYNTSSYFKSKQELEDQEQEEHEQQVQQEEQKQKQEEQELQQKIQQEKQQQQEQNQEKQQENIYENKENKENQEEKIEEVQENGLQQDQKQKEQMSEIPEEKLEESEQQQQQQQQQQEEDNNNNLQEIKDQKNKEIKEDEIKDEFVENDKQQENKNENEIIQIQIEDGNKEDDQQQNQLNDDQQDNQGNQDEQKIEIEQQQQQLEQNNDKEIEQDKEQEKIQETQEIDNIEIEQEDDNKEQQNLQQQNQNQENINENVQNNNNQQNNENIQINNENQQVKEENNVNIQNIQEQQDNKENTDNQENIQQNDNQNNSNNNINIDKNENQQNNQQDESNNNKQEQNNQEQQQQNQENTQNNENNENKNQQKIQEQQIEDQIQIQNSDLQIDEDINDDDSQKRDSKDSQNMLNLDLINQQQEQNEENNSEKQNENSNNNNISEEQQNNENINQQQESDNYQNNQQIKQQTSKQSNPINNQEDSDLIGSAGDEDLLQFQKQISQQQQQNGEQQQNKYSKNEKIDEENENEEEITNQLQINSNKQQSQQNQSQKTISILPKSGSGKTIRSKLPQRTSRRIKEQQQKQKDHENSEMEEEDEEDDDDEEEVLDLDVDINQQSQQEQLSKHKHSKFSQLSQDDHEDSKDNPKSSIQKSSCNQKNSLQRRQSQHKKSNKKKKSKKNLDTDCAICFNHHWTDLNPVVYCSYCSIGFHKLCYGIQVIPSGRFLCDFCAYFNSKKRRETIHNAQCPLCCHYKKLPLKRFQMSEHDNTDNKWAHPTCLFLFNKVDIQNGWQIVLKNPITFYEQDNDQDNTEGICDICESEQGIKVKCHQKAFNCENNEIQSSMQDACECKFQAHPICAYLHGYEIRLQDETVFDPKNLTVTEFDIQLNCTVHQSQNHDIEKQSYFRKFAINFENTCQYENYDEYQNYISYQEQQE